jgi:hypothetical protein
MGSGSGAGCRRASQHRPLVLAFQVPQASPNSQAQHRCARRHTQGSDFGVHSHDLDEGISVFQQILSQPQLRGAFDGFHSVFLSSTLKGFAQKVGFATNVLQV